MKNKLPMFGAQKTLKFSLLNKILKFVTIFLIGFSFIFAITVETEGKGCSSDIIKAKEFALKRAKLNAIEKYVGILISSKTLIVNTKIMRDIIKMQALGILKIVGTPSYSKPIIKDDDILCISVKAKFKIVEKVIKPANFGLVLILNKKEYKKSEEISIEISSEKECIPYLFNIDAQGRVYRLLPNAIESDIKLRGRLSFPTPKMKIKGYKLIAMPLPNLPSPQREEILFVCTKSKIKAFEDFFPSVFLENLDSNNFFLNSSYTQSIEKFNEILLQMNADEYDFIDDFYFIYY